MKKNNVSINFDMDTGLQNDNHTRHENTFQVSSYWVRDFVHFPKNQCINTSHMYIVGRACQNGPIMSIIQNAIILPTA